MSVLFFIGLSVFTIGGLALLVAAFRVSILWGALCFLVPPVQMLFVIVHWGKAWRSLLVLLLGVVMMLLAVVRSVYLNAPELQQFLTTYKQLVQSVTAAGSAAEQPVQEYSPDDPTIIGNTPALDEPAVEPMAAPDGTIYKCTDAQGRVTFTQQRCAGEGKVLDNLPPINTQQAQPVLQDKSPDDEPAQPVKLPAGKFHCDGRTRCSQMTSCEEAMYFLAHCPGVEMDGNALGEAGSGDGVPCESQWCGQ